jgi:hypothetical protein
MFDCNAKTIRSKIITEETNTLEVDVRSNPDSLWNKSNYIPLMHVKLLIGQTLNSLGHILSEETKNMLKSVLEQKED